MILPYHVSSRASRKFIIPGFSKLWLSNILILFTTYLASFGVVFTCFETLFSRHCRLRCLFQQKVHWNIALGSKKGDYKMRTGAERNIRIATLTFEEGFFGELTCFLYMDLNDTPPRQAYGCLNDLSYDLRVGAEKENDKA